MRERQTWDYKDTLIFNIRPFPDVIPVIGLVTHMESMRRALGDSVTNFYNPRRLFKKEAWIQPEPTDQQAAMRSWILAAKINGFVFYHASFLAAPVILL